MPEFGILSAALLGALAFGGGDMLGACAARRLGTSGAVALSQIAAVALLWAYVSAKGFSGLGEGEIVPALAGGLAHAVALVLLYHGLAHGRVGVVAPVCAMSSIVVPLVADLALARPLTDAQLTGVVLCSLAVLLIAGSAEGNWRSRAVGWSVVMGIAGGLAYGAADVLLATIPTSDTTGVVFVARCACVALAVPLALLMAGRAGPARAGSPAPMTGGRVPPAATVMRRRALPHLGVTLAVGAGVFDVVGQMGYMLAATRGSMGVASAITALFPAVTVMLAVLLFRERVTNAQMVGYAVAGCGVIVLAA